MTCDSLALQPILYMNGRQFINLEQKRSLHRLNRREEIEEVEEVLPDIPTITCLEYEASLCEGMIFRHRQWGDGVLLSGTKRKDDVLWQIDFSGVTKTLSEKWLIENCKQVE